MDIVIGVSEDKIREAGDSDETVLVYRIYDEVINVSSDWSLRGYVSVELDPDKLEAPEIVNPDPDAAPGDPIDVGALNGEGVDVLVWAERSGRLKPNDVVTLTWVGTTAQGQVITYTPAAQTVKSRLPDVLTFTIPNAQVKALAQGFARAWYTVARKGSAQLVSKRAGIDLIGSNVQLPPPSISEAVDGVLQPTLQMATVVVPKQAQLEYGDSVTITWRGLRSDGSPLTYTATRPVTTAMVGKDIEFKVDGAANLKPLNGGTLEVSYQVVREGLGKPLESTPLGVQVGQAQLELPAPYCPQAQDGELDPNTVDEVTIEIAPYTDMRIGQTVQAQWCDEGGKCIYDEMKITSRNVGKTVVFHIPHGDWSTTLTGRAQVTYQVIETHQPTRVSAPLSLKRAEQSTPLPDPIVEGANNGMLTPAGDATVLIPLGAQLKYGDEVLLDWDGDGMGGKTQISYMTLSDQVAEIRMQVPAKFVEANINNAVRVFYMVYRFDGSEQYSGTVNLRVQQAPLPLPVFVEATAGQQLNPDDVSKGATVLVDAVAHFKRGDKVTVTVESPVSSGNFSQVVTIAAGAEEKALRITVPYATINASNRQSIKLKYSVVRASGVPVENSPVNVYLVNRVIGTGELRIFGARYGASTYRASSTSRILSAFNRQTLQPILAEWRYKDETSWTAGTTWFDRQPWKPLRVRTQSDEVELNPANIIGNGNDATVNGSAAFVALRDERDGGVRDMVGWGSAAHGASIPPTLITFDDIVEISCTRSAYAARRANGFVVGWGNAAEGGTLRANETGDFVEVRSNSVAFVGRKRDGRLSGWGSLPNGADIPPAIIGQAGYTAVYGAGTAFAAQKANGQLVAWGSAANGGTLPSDIGALTDIIYVKGNFAAFAARRSNKRIVAWGNAGYGGTVPLAIATLTDVESLEGATAQAFSALRSTGQVVAWGAASHGGTVPAEIAGLTDVLEVSTTWHAFCARRRNGRVVAWGNTANGGTVPAAVAQLSDIVQVTGSAWAFAALRSNGTVVAWGRAEAGGDTSRVVGQLTNVRAVYANSNGFTALTSDGRVVTWGQALGGGDSTSVQPALSGLVTTGHKVGATNVAATADEEWLRTLPNA
ncbi:RCC1 domain-containing protein [Pseudomonas aegrilactucae]|uniref:Alpha-tubulin suppressor-like RCC1 family protein n=1 Tax=Pseudomonas aegrilactucae TaxID=2854028 RepID=A0A9Q3A9D1_9PSED|nr:hypothetical protein [Pseudomonas aegrilactucae]MBV6286142.1 hypothetical protein [Pseudomonas aegrilactucae]